MRRLLLAIMICCVAWPCAASFLEPIPPQWSWPPMQRRASMSPDSLSVLPPLLVSAVRFGSGLSDDLRREPVPAIIDPNEPATPDVFPMVMPDDVPMPRPRLEMAVADVPIEAVCDTLASAAEAQQLPVPFFIRLIWQESKFDPRAVSPVGAQGVAQFMPETAAAMGLRNPFDPLEALRYSARLLRDLVGQFGNLGLAAAAYNAGPKRIVDWLAKRGKLPDETRHYVKSITGHDAERWRFTRPGRLALPVPKRAPCQGATAFAAMVEVPAPPPPPPPRPKARTRILAKKDKDQKVAQDHGKNQKVVKEHGKDRKAVVRATRKAAIIDVSAARRQERPKHASAAKHSKDSRRAAADKKSIHDQKPIVARANAARNKAAKKLRTANR
jgi:hypothetical protein